jgi:hypothetical protein
MLVETRPGPTSPAPEGSGQDFQERAWQWEWPTVPLGTAVPPPSTSPLSGRCLPPSRRVRVLFADQPCPPTYE